MKFCMGPPIYRHPILKPNVPSQKLGSGRVSVMCSPSQLWHCGRLLAWLLTQARTAYMSSRCHNNINEISLPFFCFSLFKTQVLDLDNQPGRCGFQREKSGGRMARIHVHSLEEEDGDRTRCAKSIDGLCVLYHFRATIFIQNRRFGFGWLWNFAIVDMFDILCWIFC